MRFTLLARLAGAAVLAVLALPQLALADGDGNGDRDKKAFFDSRATPAAETELAARERGQAESPPASLSRFRDALGREGVVEIDPSTGTPRFIGKTNGFLTGPSGRAPADIALDFIRLNAKVFGLGPAAVGGLQLTKDYVSIDGTHHLSFAQTAADGIPVFSNGIRANVTRLGQLINFTGSPVASLGGAAGKQPDLSATDAVVAAKDEVAQPVIPAATVPGGDPTTEETTYTDGDTASLVYFQAVDGTRLAWKTEIYGTDGSAYETLVDAATGRILYRRSLVDYANGLVWDNYPGATTGGVQRTADLSSWLTPGATTLTGQNAHVYSDLNDNNRSDAGEEVPTSDSAGNFDYTFTPFANTLNSDCTTLFPCSWNSSFPTGLRSWRVNRAQNAVQVFFLVNTYHDHLAAAPIGFTEAAGAFQGTDALNAEPDNGALTLAGVYPDLLHTDSASMATPPDGQSPRMQMYLFNDPQANDPILGGTARSDPFIQANGGDEADLVYHEYTHGLSNRLVVDATGNSTLGGAQARSMGEAWSDWYAMDFLVGQGQITDTPADGELRLGQYVAGGQDLIRTQPLDCAVGSTSASCPGTPGAGTGGYTYDDFGKIVGRPEVHADGEIWGETLWDLRAALGQTNAEGLVTRAMELSPSNPSFLDMRNSILEADLIDSGGRNHDTIWHVFANRGMGYFAAAVDGEDIAPAADFSMPPREDAENKLKGLVTDHDTGLPLPGVLVQFGGHHSGFTGTLAAVSDARGRYTIKRIFAGTYPKVSASGSAGYAAAVQTLTIGRDDDTSKVNWTLRRDYASLAGGGAITAFNGPDFSTFGCGLSGAIDLSDTNGWGSTTDRNSGAATGRVTPKFVVVQLPQPVNVSEISVNPSNTCGDGSSASTRGYKVEVSSDGTTFTEVAKGVFYRGNRGQESTVFSGASANVRFVKFWMLNPQVPIGADCTGPADCGADPDSNPGVALRCTPPHVDPTLSGCSFMDLSELEVYGRLP